MPWPWWQTVGVGHTEQLRDQVRAVRATATSLSLWQRQWRIETYGEDITSANVVLDVGAVPKRLSYPHLKEIPVEVALDPEKLAAEPLGGATVAVSARRTRR